MVLLWMVLYVLYWVIVMADKFFKAGFVLKILIKLLLKVILVPSAIRKAVLSVKLKFKWVTVEFDAPDLKVKVPLTTLYIE